MKDLTKGSELKLIFFFAVPLLLASIFQQLYSTTDSIIVGRFVGKVALASIGSSFPIIFFMLSIAIGITLGATIVISQLFGAKDIANVRVAITTTFIFLSVFSVFVTLFGLFFSSFILKLLSVPDDVFPYALLYLKVMFSGAFFIFGYNGISSVLRGLGDSKRPLFILIMTSFLNILLDIIFVLPLKMGVFGAAIATVISEAISFIVSVFYLNAKTEVMKFKLSDIKFDYRMFIKILKMGVPSAIQQMSVALGFMVLVRIVNQFGTDSIAAYTAASRLDTFASMPSLNLSLALATFVGQNIGAKRFDRIHNGLKSTLLISIIYSLLITFIVFFFGKELISLFSKDKNVIGIGANYLVIVGSSYIIFSSMFVLTGLLRGAGDAMYAMFCSVLALWPARIGFAIILSKFMGVTGIWYSLPLGWVLGVVLLVIRYYSGRWKNKSVVDIEPAEI